MRTSHRSFFLAIAAVGISACAPQDDATQQPDASAWQTPRTEWGEPDLRGVWPIGHLTGVPLRRPAEFGDRLFLRDEELAARGQQYAGIQGAYDQEIDQNTMGVGHGIEILQSPGYVVIRLEMIHEARVIHTVGSPPFNNTPISDQYVLTERLTRTGPDTITYQATLDDPVIWTAPWTVELPWQRDDSYQFFEYACHEDNSMVRNYIVTSRHERAQQSGATQP